MGQEKRSQLVGLEERVLMAAARLGDEADAVAIRDVIEERGNQRVTFGAIYTTLDRLEDKGYIKVRQGGPAVERGGRTRRLYQIQGAGMQALQEAQHIRDRMLDGVSLGLKPLGGVA